MGMNEKILKQTEAYYSEKIKRFGATSRGVDWNSKESQRVRFEQLTGILRHEGTNAFSVCDYGCGYGYYSEYLREAGHHFHYTGIDLSEQMIFCASQKYGMQTNTVFVQDSKIEQTYDYIVSSGIFNVKQDTEASVWTSYMTEALENFHKHSQKGFAFNCLTKYSDSDYMKDYLYYGDPLYFFDYAKKHFSRNVALLHDYGLYEFTILVRKQVGEI